MNEQGFEARLAMQEVNHSPEAVEPAPATCADAPPRRVRRTLVVCAVVVFSLGTGYYSGRLYRHLTTPAAEPSVAPTDDLAAADAVSPPSSRPLLDPDAPLPKTAQALIQETVQAVEQLVATFPERVDAREVLARASAWQGAKENAVRIWKQCLEQDAKYVHAYVGMSSFAAERGDHSEALRLASAALQIDPANFQARALAADAHLQLGEPDKVVSLLKDYLKTDPRSQGHFLLGQAFAQLTQWQEAQTQYEAAIKIYPEYREVYAALSRTYEKLGDAEKSQQMMKRFQELTGTAQAGTRIRGVGVGDLESMRNGAAVIYTDAGRVYYTGERSRDAEALWLRAAALDPKNTGARQSLAWLCRQTGRKGEVIVWMQEMSQIEPHNVSYWIEMGRIYEELSQINMAESSFRRACELGPQQPEGYAALADLFLRYEHNLPETVSLAQQAVKFHPGPENLAMLSAALRANGDLDGALTSIEQALKLAPESPSYRAVRDAVLAEKK
jgi:tetratricopeptide (TPR) repeat protein